MKLHKGAVVVQSLSCDWLCLDCNTPVLSVPHLPFAAISRSLPKFKSIELVMLSNHLILCHPSWITALSWRRGMCNSMKLKAMPCRATQDRRVIVKSSDKKWPTGGRNGKPLLYSHCKNPINSIKRQKDVTPKDEPPQIERCPRCYWERTEGNY